MLEGRILIAGLMLLIFASAVGVSFTYAPDARFLPLVIGIPGTVLALVQFVNELRDHTKRETPSGEKMRELRMFAWFVGVVGGLIIFGFIYAGPVLVGAYLYFAGKEKWYVALAGAGGCWVILYFVFEQFLGLPPWEGLISQWVYG